MAKPKMVDPSDFEKPVEQVVTTKNDNFFLIENLPSRGLFYPEGTKIFGRPLTVREIKKITGMNESNYNIIIRDILSSAIKGVNVDDIMASDKLYLIFWLRANTYKSANFVTPYTCERCGKETEFSFDVDHFEIKDINEEAVLEFTLEHSEDEIVLSYLTVGKEDSVFSFKESLKGSIVKFDEDTIALASMISSINGKSMTMRSKCDYVMGLNPEDYAQLDSYVSQLDFGIIPIIKAVCGHVECRGVNAIPVSFQPEIFIPRYKLR